MHVFPVPYLLVYILIIRNGESWFLNKMSLSKQSKPIFRESDKIPSWDSLNEKILETETGKTIRAEEDLRANGGGKPHPDAKIRLFGTKNSEPRVTFYRDTAAWCPYCQKVWILLEEKRIPYIIEKINMRSYGDKPESFLKIVPSGLLPAIKLDGRLQTESLDIMLNLDRTFSGPNHPSMWPSDTSPELSRAQSLMRLERDLFSRWCNLVFRPAGESAIKRFEQGLDEVDKQLQITPGPWFLTTLSIVDLTFVTHIERMCASVAYWSGFKIRGDGRWPAIERWLTAFEDLPSSSYMATKSDYYTHVQDIPPQYGPGYSLPGSEHYAEQITGTDNPSSWRLPLPPLSPTMDVEPINDSINPGDDVARQTAAYRLINNHEAVVKFALRGAGTPGRKRFQAPLADPFATPALEYLEEMDEALRYVAWALIDGYTCVGIPALNGDGQAEPAIKESMVKSLCYLRDRVGVPRDMPYVAARQLRAHLNWIVDNFQ